MRPDKLADARERIDDCIRLGERMSPHFAMDLLERIEALENKCALYAASLEKADTESRRLSERVRVLEAFALEVASDRDDRASPGLKERARAALATEPEREGADE